MNFFVYILRTSNHKLYIGHTNNPSRRIQDHGNSLGAKYVKYHGGVFNLIYTEPYPTRAEAMQREKQLKRWTRAKKEGLIAGDFALLKSL